MLNSGYIQLRSWFRLCLIVPILAAQLQAQQLTADQNPPRQGVRVIEVEPQGHADRAGIQVMDLLTRYGEFTVTDYSTYFKARDAHLKQPDKKVQLELWRGRTRFTVSVFPNWLGMDINEFSPVAYQLDAVLKGLAMDQGIPDYKRDVEFKDHFQRESTEQKLAKAKAMIDDAEAQGTLTPAQILVARISVILNDAPQEDLKKQDALLAEFVRDQPPQYIGYLGDIFMERDLYRPAKALLKQYLMTDPENISVRLNVGYVNLQLHLWDEVEAGADLVLTNPDNLGEHGLFVAYQQKAYGALSRGEYNTAINFAQKAFALEPANIELVLIQLAAATTGDMAKLNDVSRIYKEEFPEDYERNRLQIDAVEALALAKRGQDELARAVVARWKEKDRVEGRIRYYWRRHPGGAKVIDNWFRFWAN